MAKNLTLRIYTPEKTALDKKVYRVLLPYGTTNITILEDRAPTSLALHAGVLQILKEDDSVEKSFFMDNGVADVAENVCQISTAHFIECNQISVDEAAELVDKEPQNAEFYNMIANYIQSFGQ